MNGQGMKEPHGTVAQIHANHRAEDEKARLFAGLEIFVNAGNSEEEYRRLQNQVPSFWPLDVRAPLGPQELDQPLAWPPAGQPLFCAFRDYLRRLWRSDFYKTDGSTMDGRYLEYLLGLETRYAVAPPYGLLDAGLPDDAFTEGWLAICREHRDAWCARTAYVSPEWRSSKLAYVSSRDFQKAVYLLLSESWRAKVCRRCDKYFIAYKTAQMFCSTTCSNQNKLESGRRYWHEKGSVLRERRTGEGKR
jgi:hypothetical protein